METNNQLLIFKTNIREICSNCEMHKALASHAEIHHWSIDTDDVDCVLRISTGTLTPSAIISLINTLGYQCSEL
jgi:hypothetical protein